MAAAKLTSTTYTVSAYATFYGAEARLKKGQH